MSAGDQNADGNFGLAWTPKGKIVYSSVPNGRSELWDWIASPTCHKPRERTGRWIAFEAVADIPTGMRSVLYVTPATGGSVGKTRKGPSPALDSLQFNTAG